VNRRPYIDWLRGVAVLIMIEAHVLDAWTSVAERTRAGYRWGIVMGGMGAPLFLFLAGVTLALAAGARRRNGLSMSAIAAAARRRGWQIFGLAFLFRLQSWLISGGRFPDSLLKVDILNVMGLAVVAAALLWHVGRAWRVQAGWLAGAACVSAMAAPLVLASPLLAHLPAPVAWYFAPVPGFSSFTLLPWAGFLFAGAALGLWLDVAHTDSTSHDHRLILGLGALGAAIAAAGLGASLLPALYTTTTFWSTSPSFFFVRLGVVVLLLALASWWTLTWPGRSALAELGAASLFVYWVHVEMVYGAVSRQLHRELRLEQALAGYAGFCVFMFLLVRLKNRISRRRADQVRRQPIAARFDPARLASPK
jgi:uncharacterized membrane protein